MKIIVVQPESLKQFPPTISILQSLSRDNQVLFISKSSNEEYLDFFKKNKIQLIYNIDKIRLRYGIIPAIIERIYNKYKLWQEIKKNNSTNTLVWTTTEKSIHLFGYKYLKVNHVMQLMELIESNYIKDSTFFTIALNFSKIAKNAKITIVPEYNRSHLMKTWWNLDKHPFVLPNKLTLHPRTKNIDIFDQFINKKIAEIIYSGKKIILYQGVVHEQRNLVPFINAVNKIEDKYVLVLMTELNNFTKILIQNYKNIIHIPWINAPYHLQITSWATIGLLSYEPKKIGHLSVLNALYCAPNKIFEYSGFGIPMLSNDCPSLGPVFNYNNNVRIRFFMFILFINIFKYKREKLLLLLLFLIY